MTTQQLLHEARSRIGRLSAEELQIANAFLAFLEANRLGALAPDDQAAVESFKRAWTQAHSGRVRPLHELQWGASASDDA